jgi:hypothetical protein
MRAVDPQRRQRDAVTPQQPDQLIPLVTEWVGERDSDDRRRKTLERAREQVKAGIRRVCSTSWLVAFPPELHDSRRQSRKGAVIAKAL